MTSFTSDHIRAAIFGLSVGDAIGVPVEFRSREEIRKNPVVDMKGFGTHNQRPGTWSDDSSLAFCLAESLSDGYDIESIGKSFAAWCFEGKWTPYGKVFDIGISTKDAMMRIYRGEPAATAGNFDEYSNGNGSLMRIIPLLFYIFDLEIEKRLEITKEVSSITHGHIRSKLACFYYLEFARNLIILKDKFKAYSTTNKDFKFLLHAMGIIPAEQAHFERLLSERIHLMDENSIHSSGYVIHTLEASIWCLLITDNYKDAVLKAVNLGDDTDTTGAVTGGIAGLLYGVKSIPQAWYDKLARIKDIEALCNKLSLSCTGIS